MYPKDQIQVNVEEFLKNPSRVERQLARLTKDKTIADYAFGQGDANNGAVIYDEVTGFPADPDRDVEIIAPGAEFPILGVSQEDSKTAKVDKYGGAGEMTFEAVRRNDTDTLNKRLILVSNQIIRRVNAVAVKALLSNQNINQQVIDSPWSETTSDPIADLFAAKGLINDNELGYVADLGLINPLDAQRYILGRKDIREQLPRESKELNPVLSGDLADMVGLEWITSAAVPRGTIYTLQRGVSGSIRDEEGGIKSNVYDEHSRQVKVIQGWRSIVPILTDPKSVTRITGFGQ